jgi:hypothetical protein
MAGGTSANRIAKWNGTSWSNLGTGINSSVFSLKVYNNNLIIGGTFSIAGGTNSNSIAKWNGSSWSPLGSGLNSIVYALTIFNNDLIAGGMFTTAGGIPANRIAKWSDVVNIKTGSNEIPSAFKLYQNYPNPFNPITTIKFDILEAGNVSLKIYDILGREVSVLVNQYKQAGLYEVLFDGSTFTSGTYFYKLETGDFYEIKKFVLIK